jgi:molybdate transport system substrate-binding protein
MHEPLAQRMVLVKGAGPVAHAFARYLQQPAAREILRRHGFELPDA